MALILYGKENCPNCDKAKKLLEINNLKYIYFDVGENKEAYDFLVMNGHKSVPQVFKDNMKCIGGYKELVLYVTHNS